MKYPDSQFFQSLPWCLLLICLCFSQSRSLAQENPLLDLKLAKRTLAGNDILVTNGPGRYILGGPAMLRKQGYDLPFNWKKGIWIGGTMPGGNPVVTAIRQNDDQISQNQFGPLDPATGKADPELIGPFGDKLWRVTYGELSAFWNDRNDGVINPLQHPSLFAWPGYGNPYFETFNGFPFPYPEEMMAPFYDYDKDGFYDPMQGDWPKDFGDMEWAVREEVMYTIFHLGDVDDPALKSATPMPLNVHVISSPMQCPGEGGNANRAILTHYLIHNVTTQPLDSMYIGFWQKPELSCPVKAGFEPDFNTAYFYTDPDSCDQGFIFYDHVYAASPGINPWWDDDVLEGDGAMYFLNQASPGYPFAISAPITAKEYYRILTGTWKDGTKLTRNGIGYNKLSGDYTKAPFDGVPGSEVDWTMPDEISQLDYTFLYRVKIRGELKPGGWATLAGVTGMYESPVPDGKGLHASIKSYGKHLQSTLFDNRPDCMDGITDPILSTRTWPGDVNLDGQVNGADFIIHRYHFDQEGLCEFVPLSWSAQPRTYWNQISIAGQDLVHLDVSGNGKVDEEDVFGIAKHYWHSRSPFHYKPHDLIGKQLRLVPNSFSPKDTLWVHPDDTTFLLYPRLEGLNPYGIWFGVKHPEEIQIAGSLFDHSHLISSVLPNRTDVAFTSQQKNGIWTPSYLTFRIDQETLFDESSCLMMWLVDGYAYAKETLIETPLSMSPVWICQEMISANDHTITEQTGPILFPNPSTGQIYMHHGIGPCSFRLWNSVGQLVQSGILEQELNLNQFHPGIYRIELKTSGGQILHEQIVIMR